ncbi:MAG: hypothetical protein ACFFA1_06900 [Promethearchaeota archaeon]
MKKYNFTLEEAIVVISDRNNCRIGEFIPEIEWDDIPSDLSELGEVPLFQYGILTVTAIKFPRHFVEGLFSEGESILKLKKTLENYLREANMWIRILRDHPEMKVVSDGYADFKCEIFVTFDHPTNDFKEVEEKLTRILDDLPMSHSR